MGVSTITKNRHVIVTTRWVNCDFISQKQFQPLKVTSKKNDRMLKMLTYSFGDSKRKELNMNLIQTISEIFNMIYLW